MDISTQLFQGQAICLGPIDHEKDPEIIARWTNDPEYLRMLGSDPARPLSTAQVKKRLEKVEKQIEEEKNNFYFTIRRRSENLEENDRLIGFARFYWIEWNFGVGRVQLGIGDSKDRRQGYGREALDILLRFAFAELNLYAVRAVIPEYNTAARKLFVNAGFVEEGCQREALNRAGKRWDMLHVGILQTERESRL